MSAQEPKFTSTLGYYNGNKWPIHLVISELGVTLHLKAGEYILDRQGRKINDPFFDKYAKPLQLSKELSRNGQVPVIAVPHVTPASLADRPAHSVTAVTKFTADRKPIMPPPQAAKPKLDVNTPTHKGMSVEEARRLGFIGGAVREVPEDYGVTDTAGRPVGVDQAPPIKYAMESTPRVRQAEALPEGLAEIDEKVDPGTQSARQTLVSSMRQAAANSGVVDNPTGFMNQATMHGTGQIITPSGQPASSGVSESEEPLPPPTIFAQEQVQPSHPAPTKGVPDVLGDARKAAQSKAPAPKDVKPFVCSKDGKDFRYRSQLAAYAKRKYPDQVSEILAPYPESE
ncbi:MAG: hypothetical protein AB7O65_11795 [Candidatus Korobacteraceae bacterium]